MANKVFLNFIFYIYIYIKYFINLYLIYINFIFKLKEKSAACIQAMEDANQLMDIWVQSYVKIKKLPGPGEFACNKFKNVQ